MYGNFSTYKYEEWLEKSVSVAAIANIWYDAQSIRMLTFLRVGIPVDAAEKEKFLKLCEVNKVTVPEED